MKQLPTLGSTKGLCFDRRVPFGLLDVFSMALLLPLGHDHGCAKNTCSVPKSAISMTSFSGSLGITEKSFNTTFSTFRVAPFFSFFGLGWVIRLRVGEHDCLTAPRGQTHQVGSAKGGSQRQDVQRNHRHAGEVASY